MKGDVAVDAWRPPLLMARLAVLFVMAGGAEGQSLVFSRGVAGRRQCHVRVHGNTTGLFPSLHVWMSSFRSVEQTENKAHTYIHLLYLYAKQLLPTHQYSWAETGTDASNIMRFHVHHWQLIMNLFFDFVS